jgi:hypothetical protein
MTLPQINQPRQRQGEYHNGSRERKTIPIRVRWKIYLNKKTNKSRIYFKNIYVVVGRTENTILYPPSIHAFAKLCA